MNSFVIDILLRIRRLCCIRITCFRVFDSASMFIRRALPRLHQPFRPYAASAIQRAYATTTLSNGIKLAYDIHEPPNASQTGSTASQHNAPPIVFIHGLFGSKKNNRSMSKYAPSSPDNITEGHPFSHQR